MRIAMGGACTAIGDRCGRDDWFFTNRAGAQRSFASVVPLASFRPRDPEGPEGLQSPKESKGSTRSTRSASDDLERSLKGSAVDDLRAMRRALRGKKVSLDDFQILETVGKGGFGRVRVIKPREQMLKQGQNSALKIRKQNSVDSGADSPKAKFARSASSGHELDVNHDHNIVRLADYATCVKLINKVKAQQSMCGLKISIEALRREIMVLSTLEHPLIINLISVFHDEKRVCVIYEYVNGGELRTYLEERLVEDRVFSQMSRAKRNEEMRQREAELSEVKAQEQQQNPGMLVCDSPERFFVADVVLMMEYLQHETKRIVSKIVIFERPRPIHSHLRSSLPSSRHQEILF